VKNNLFPTDRSGHKKAAASLIEIGYELYKQGKIKFEGGIYKWI